jgi:hypothetical protein
MLDLEAQTRFQPHLLSGECLLWTGRPPQGLILRPADALMIPFSLMWGGFAIFWELGVPASNAPWFFRLWGIPFVLVGLYLIIGRFLHDAVVRRGIFYAVSDRRVLQLRTGLFGGLRSLDIKRLPQLDLEERRNGRGTLKFELSEDNFALFRPRRRDWSWWVPSLSFDLRFQAIEQPRFVYDLISRTAAA